MELDAKGQWSGGILVEDYIQHKVNELFEQFKQRLGNLFSLEWCACMTREHQG